MAYSRPSSCPKCGSKEIFKEQIMGSQTGDWICGECGEIGQLNGVPIGTVLTEPKTESKDPDN
ncbi:primase-helicase zinc-binding domain-containing protein [Cronobacter dublinensis]|uniref:primase-helicase zinc-binding domain-containing protein n=1 Tax=Cronobacter dublinensis TaxID=413497 RepID=UPI001319F2B4